MLPETENTKEKQIGMPELAYPSEKRITKDFIKRVEKACEKTKEGKAKRYSLEEFKKEFVAS